MEESKFLVIICNCSGIVVKKNSYGNWRSPQYRNVYKKSGYFEVIILKIV